MPTDLPPDFKGTKHAEEPEPLSAGEKIIGGLLAIALVLTVIIVVGWCLSWLVVHWPHR